MVAHLLENGLSEKRMACAHPIQELGDKIHFYKKRITALKMIKSKLFKRVTVDDLTRDFAKVPLSRRSHCCRTVLLKGHGNETDFLGFLQKLVPHRSLTLPFEPFRFWLRIRDIRN